MKKTGGGVFFSKDVGIVSVCTEPLCKQDYARFVLFYYVFCVIV